MGPGASHVSEIAAEIDSKLPDLKPPPSLEPEAARFRLFDFITTFLKNAAQSQPLMPVLDDLHWADKPSLLLLQFLALETASSRLLVVGTYRDVELSRQQPLSETLAELSRPFPTGGFRRILLRGLYLENTALLIEANAGIDTTMAFVQAVYHRTEGNPFFMTLENWAEHRWEQGRREYWENRNQVSIDGKSTRILSEDTVSTTTPGH